mgnify:CR=1 FL=1
MGTNYYVAENLCECCERYDRGMHIGKSSYGWAFSFHGTKELNSWKAWKEYLKDKKIVGDYDDFIEYDKFVELIEVYKSPDYVNHNDRKNLSRNQEMRNQDLFDPSKDWDDESGYSFSTSEFS